MLLLTLAGAPPVPCTRSVWMGGGALSAPNTRTRSLQSPVWGKLWLTAVTGKRSAVLPESSPAPPKQGRMRTRASTHA